MTEALKFTEPNYLALRACVRAITDCQVALATAVYKMTSGNQKDDKRPPLIRTMAALATLMECIANPVLIYQGVTEGSTKTGRSVSDD